MKLKDTVIQRILETGSDLSLNLAKVLGFTQDWIKKLAKKNDNNGPLTTMAAIDVIKQDMDTTDESKILVSENQPVPLAT